MSEQMFTLSFLVALSVFAVMAGSLKFRELGLIFVLGLTLRLVLVGVDALEIYRLPGSRHDAGMFIATANAWATLDWGQLLGRFDHTDARVYSWLAAIFMKAFSVNPLVMPLLNVLAGVLVVMVTAAIAKDLFGMKAARVSAAVMAFYPYAAFNSAVALREEFSILAFVVGLHFFIRWARYGGLVPVFPALLFFGIATAIHPGWVAAFVGVGGYAAIITGRAISSLVVKQSVARTALQQSVTGFAIMVFAGGLVLASGGLKLGKSIEIGSDTSGFAEVIEDKFQRESLGGSGYPLAIATGDPYAQPWLIPARMIYFVWSPFPWDIRAARHLLGLVSTALYLLLCWRIYRSFPALRERPECVAMLVMLAALVFVFAVGTTNIGTAIRHRCKLLVLFVLAAGPEFAKGRFLPRVSLRRGSRTAKRIPGWKHAR